MCSTPSMPKVETDKQEIISAPTQADAKVSKAAHGSKDKSRALASRDIKTAPRILAQVVPVQNKKLLA